MLVALLGTGGDRIEAAHSSKAAKHYCPGCNDGVILAKGQIRRPYFAHNRGAVCGYAAAETWEHQQAKEDFVAAFRARGLAASPEVPVLSVQGDRRADVFVTSPTGNRSVAVELQHSSVTPAELYLRTAAYLAASIGVSWIVVLNFKKLRPVRLLGTDLLRVLKYAAPPWQRWLSELHEMLWAYEATTRKMWRLSLWEHLLWRNETSWYSEGGEENSAGGYWYSSERWNDLYLQGPFELTDLRVKPRNYGTLQIQGNLLPKGIAAELVPTAPPPEIAMRRKWVEQFTPQDHIGGSYFRDEALIEGSWVTPAEEEFS